MEPVVEATGRGGRVYRPGGVVTLVRDRYKPADQRERYTVVEARFHCRGVGAEWRTYLVHGGVYLSETVVSGVEIEPAVPRVDPEAAADAVDAGYLTPGYTL